MEGFGCEEDGGKTVKEESLEEPLAKKKKTVQSSSTADVLNPTEAGTAKVWIPFHCLPYDVLKHAYLAPAALYTEEDKANIAYSCMCFVFGSNLLFNHLFSRGTTPTAAALQTLTASAPMAGGGYRPLTAVEKRIVLLKIVVHGFAMACHLVREINNDTLPYVKKRLNDLGKAENITALSSYTVHDISAIIDIPALNLIKKKIQISGIEKALLYKLINYPPDVGIGKEMHEQLLIIYKGYGMTCIENINKWIHAEPSRHAHIHNSVLPEIQHFDVNYRTIVNQYPEMYLYARIFNYPELDKLRNAQHPNLYYLANKHMRRFKISQNHKPTVDTAILDSASNRLLELAHETMAERLMRLSSITGVNYKMSSVLLDPLPQGENVAEKLSILSAITGINYRML